MNMLPRLLLLLSLTVFLLAPAVNAQSLKSIRDEGIALYDQGKFAEALGKFTLVLQQNPRDPYARSYLAKAKVALENDLGKNNLESQLKKVIIPEINFKDAPLGDVLDYFAARAEELSGGKIVANIIYKGTPEERKNTLITLSVRNVPMTEAIRYVGQLSNTNFRYEQHAVVAEPRNSINSNPVPQPTGNETEKPGTVFGESVKSADDIFK